jgi:hypothetical protein
MYLLYLFFGKNSFNLELKLNSMKNLNDEKMNQIHGGSACGAMEAAGAVYMSGLGLALVSLGPAGWGAALIAGAGAMAVVAICNE